MKTLKARYIPDRSWQEFDPKDISSINTIDDTFYLESLPGCLFRLSSIESVELEDWKADAERLAELVEEQMNAYNIMGLDGVKSITREGYENLEEAIKDHHELVERTEGEERCIQ